MSPLALHMRTRLADSRVIARNEAERRIAMSAIFRLARSVELLAVGLADTHLHLLACLSGVAGGRLMHAIEVSLKRLLSHPIGFVMYPHRRVRDQLHLENAFEYVLTQHEHHDVQTDTLREGTSLHDLLGLRMQGAYTRPIARSYLPRLRRQTLLGWLGVDTLEPADGPLVWMTDATLSAACLPDLTRKSPATRRARRALLEVAGPGRSQAELAGLLHTSKRSVQRLRQLPVDHDLVTAIRLQLALRAQRDEARAKAELSNAAHR